jgi:pimeloyl-ACP methyl ester carboxylesterase
MSGPQGSPGTLPPVILVHGFASSFQHNWVRTGWVDVLEARGHPIVGMDLPGHGGNEDPGGREAAVSRLARLAGRLGTVDLVGFSVGAWVSAMATAAGRISVRRVVLVGLGDGMLGGAAARRPADSAAISLTGPAEYGDVRGALFRRMAAAAGNDLARLAEFNAAPSSGLTPELLRAISCPVLVVIGDNDWTGPARQVCDALADCTLLTLPRTDHFATAEHPEAILATARFLAA